MSIKNQIRESNPIMLKTIRNAIRNNKFSHAYLLSSTQNIEMTLFQNFMLQAAACETNGVVACGECYACLRIESNGYVDLSVIDGSQGLIKKEAVIKVLNVLNQTPLEKDAKKLLLIKNVENSNKQSFNALLAFLETPTKNTHIIMTTNALNNVLNTIKSRVQIISLNPIAKHTIMTDLENKNVIKKYVSVLANIFPSSQSALYSYENDFIKLYKDVINIMTKFNESKYECAFQLTQLLVKKYNYSLMLDILNLFFNDIWKHKVGRDIVFTGEKLLINKIVTKGFNFSGAINALTIFKHEVKSNVNFDLAKAKFINELVR